MSMLARFATTGGGVATYIEDVFSTYLYDGNGSTQTITNGIDLSGKGGMVWIKRRDAATAHGIYDTVRGALNRLTSDATDAQISIANTVTAFNSNGFSLGSSTNVNGSGHILTSWTFREAPKFFDVVTYTGNGANRTIAHNLGSVPGMIIVKRTDSADNWVVYHRSLGSNQYMLLESTVAATTSSTIWNNTSPTSSNFSLGTSSGVNINGGTYVAYLFAHDAGGFGASGSDNVISCGSFTSDVSGNASVTLGYEPQWLLYKPSTGADNWYIVDSMRGFLAPGTTGMPVLSPNLSSAEQTVTTRPGATATGFSVGVPLGNTTYIYIAIRRGPMKTPTTGTSVFSPIARTGNGTGGSPSAVTTGIVTDTAMVANRTSNVAKFNTVARLTNNLFLRTAGTNAETGSLPAFPTNTFDLQNGFYVGNDSDLATLTNGNGSTYINYAFRRAPGFFDVVCYTGNGATQNVSHNLAVAPELMLIKRRNVAGDNFVAYCAPAGTGNYAYLTTMAFAAADSGFWNSTVPTASVFSLGNRTQVNGSSSTYVAYLFATVAGVSKVFSYTGNGSSQTINCGFTGGARFVLIKRTDSTGDWYVWDSARGIVAGNDPHLSLNSTAAEVTTDDSVDTDSTGFVVNQLAATNVNVNAATYIGIAVA